MFEKEHYLSYPNPIKMNANALYFYWICKMVSLSKEDETFQQQVVQMGSDGGWSDRLTDGSVHPQQ